MVGLEYQKSEVGFGKLCQRGAGHALKVDVAAVLEGLEALGHVGQARAQGAQVRGVNLRQVAQADDFGAVPRPGNDGLDLVRCQVLGLVNNDQAVLKAAAPDVVHGFEVQRYLAEDVIHAGGHVLIVFMEGFEVVDNGAQPGLHLLCFGARQKADVFVQPLGGAGGNDAFVHLAGNRHLDAGGQGQNGFARAGGTGQVHQVDVRVQQQVQSHGLVDVPGHQPPDFLIHQVVLMEVFDNQVLVGDPGHLADKAPFVDHKLVDVQPGQLALTLEVVLGAALALDGFHLVDVVPERVGKLQVALGQQVDVVQQLVVVVILGFDTKAPGFQAHIDVFAHQDDVPGFVLRLQGRECVDDLVVVQVLGQGMGACTFGAHDDGEPAQRFRFLSPQNGHAFFDIFGAGITQQLIDIANGLTTVGGDGLFAGFEAVELFQNGHRNDDVVFFKVQKGVGVVDQDIGVEDVRFRASLRCSGHRASYLCGGSVALGTSLAQFPVGNQLQHVVSGDDASYF